MKFSLDFAAGIYTIRSYESGRITVLHPSESRTETGQATAPRVEIYTRSLIISRQALLTDWPPQTLAELQAEHLASALDLNPEVVLLGTGARLQFPDPAYTAPLLERGIGVEIMDTAAACRTYNILIGEERRVVAALLNR